MCALELERDRVWIGGYEKRDGTHVNDDNVHPRRGSIFELPNGAPAKRSFTLGGGFVASLYPVRRAGRQTMRVRAGAVPIQSAYVESASTGEATETSGGVLLPPKAFQGAIDRVHGDGSVEHVTLPIDCPVVAHLADGLLAYRDAATGAVSMLHVDDDLLRRARESSFAEPTSA